MKFITKHETVPSISFIYISAIINIFYSDNSHAIIYTI